MVMHVANQHAQAALPSLSQLQTRNDVDHWVTVSAASSYPTQLHGDWRAYPHMQGKAVWKELMGSAAKKFERFLDGYQIYPRCPYHENMHGSASYGGHIAADMHFKSMAREHFRDGVIIEEIRETLWQEFLVGAQRGEPNGKIRFNHADGEIQMWCGPTPASPHRTAPLSDGPMMPPSQACANTQAGHAEITSTTASGSHMLQSMQSRTLGVSQSFSPMDITFTPDYLPIEGQWYTVSEPVGAPTTPGGDCRSCPHLACKHLYKSLMKNPAELVEQILSRHNITWLECQICDRSRGWSEHIPADKHFKALYEKLCPENRPVEVAREVAQAWHQWLLPGGAVRFNYVDGEIQMHRGSVPAAVRAAAPASLAPHHVQNAVPQPHARASSNFMKVAPSTSPVPISEVTPLISLRPSHTPATPLTQISGLYHLTWRRLMQDAAMDLAMKFRAAGHLDPICEVCCNRMSEGIEDHILSEQHLQKLDSIFGFVCATGNTILEGKEGIRVQKWDVPGHGTIWFNHITGDVGLDELQSTASAELAAGSNASGVAPDVAASTTCMPLKPRQPQWKWIYFSGAPGAESKPYWACRASGQWFWEEGNLGYPNGLDSPAIWHKFQIEGQDRFCWWNSETKMYFDVEEGLEKGPWT